MAAISGDQLREMQTPIKERYRDQPGSALITLEADGSLDDCVVLQTLASLPELSVSRRRS
jgi:hypothetical protein